MLKILYKTLYNMILNIKTIRSLHEFLTHGIFSLRILFGRTESY